MPGHRCYPVITRLRSLDACSLPRADSDRLCLVQGLDELLERLNTASSAASSLALNHHLQAGGSLPRTLAGSGATSLNTRTSYGSAAGTATTGTTDPPLSPHMNISRGPSFATQPSSELLPGLTAGAARAVQRVTQLPLSTSTRTSGTSSTPSPGAHPTPPAPHALAPAALALPPSEPLPPSPPPSLQVQSVVASKTILIAPTLDPPLPGPPVRAGGLTPARLFASPSHRPMGLDGDGGQGRPPGLGAVPELETDLLHLPTNTTTSTVHAQARATSPDRRLPPASHQPQECTGDAAASASAPPSLRHSQSSPLGLDRRDRNGWSLAQPALSHQYTYHTHLPSSMAAAIAAGRTGSWAEYAPHRSVSSSQMQPLPRWPSRLRASSGGGLPNDTDGPQPARQAASTAPDGCTGAQPTQEAGSTHERVASQEAAAAAHSSGGGGSAGTGYGRNNETPIGTAGAASPPSVSVTCTSDSGVGPSPGTSGLSGNGGCKVLDEQAGASVAAATGVGTVAGGEPHGEDAGAAVAERGARGGMELADGVAAPAAPPRTSVAGCALAGVPPNRPPHSRSRSSGAVEPLAEQPASVSPRRIARTCSAGSAGGGGGNRSLRGPVRARSRLSLQNVGELLLSPPPPAETAPGGLEAGNGGVGTGRPREGQEAQGPGVEVGGAIGGGIGVGGEADAVERTARLLLDTCTSTLSTATAEGNALLFMSTGGAVVEVSDMVRQQQRMTGEQGQQQEQEQEQGKQEGWQAAQQDQGGRHGKSEQAGSKPLQHHRNARRGSREAALEVLRVGGGVGGRPGVTMEQTVSSCEEEAEEVATEMASGVAAAAAAGDISVPPCRGLRAVSGPAGTATHSPRLEATQVHPLPGAAAEQGSEPTASELWSAAAVRGHTAAETATSAAAAQLAEGQPAPGNAPGGSSLRLLAGHAPPFTVQSAPVTPWPPAPLPPSVSQPADLPTNILPPHERPALPPSSAHAASSLPPPTLLPSSLLFRDGQSRPPHAGPLGHLKLPPRLAGAGMAPLDVRDVREVTATSSSRGRSGLTSLPDAGAAVSAAEATHVGEGLLPAAACGGGAAAAGTDSLGVGSGSGTHTTDARLLGSVQEATVGWNVVSPTGGAGATGSSSLPAAGSMRRTGSSAGGQEGAAGPGRGSASQLLNSGSMGSELAGFTPLPPPLSFEPWKVGGAGTGVQRRGGLPFISAVRMYLL